MNELEERIMRILEAQQKVKPTMKITLTIQNIIDEMRVDFPIRYFGNQNTVKKLIAYWQQDIDYLQTSTEEDKRTLVGWMKSYVGLLKWFTRWMAKDG